MWTEMQRRNEALAAAMRDHEALCRQAQPDLPAVARARWRIAEASRHRLDWMIEEALPYAEKHADGETARHLHGIKDRTNAYRQRISAFVAEWPAERVAADWGGYRRTVMALRQTIKARLADETALIRRIALSSDATVKAQRTHDA